MSNELIATCNAVINGETVNAVNARELWAFLEVKTHDGDDQLAERHNITNNMEVSMQTIEDKKIIDRLRQLPIDYWDFREDDTKEYTHGYS